MELGQTGSLERESLKPPVRHQGQHKAARGRAFQSARMVRAAAGAVNSSKQPLSACNLPEDIWPEKRQVRWMGYIIEVVMSQGGEGQSRTIMREDPRRSFSSHIIKVFSSIM